MKELIFFHIMQVLLKTMKERNVFKRKFFKLANKYILEKNKIYYYL